MIKSLNQRERYMLAGGAVILVCLLIVFGVMLPYGAAIERLDSTILSRQKQLHEVRQLQVDYQALKKQAGRLQRDQSRQKSQPPLTFLEQTATQIGGRENLQLMRPLPVVMQGQLKIETIEFKLERLGLEQVLRILQKIEKVRPPMLVDRLHLKQRYDDATQLDMNVTVSSTRRN